jgi:hypothetical protein
MRHNGQMIGFSQRIRLEWLEYTTNLVLAGNSKHEIASALKERLRDRLSVGNDPERGNRDKAITILMKIWVAVPADLKALRDEALDLLQRLPKNDKILVHWCMCMAVYPFFGAVAEAAGRLLQLQGAVAAAQVQRRVREQLGERETVARAARRILRAFVDWTVLVETGEKGIYTGAPKRIVDDMSLTLWVLKGVLIAKGEKFLSLSGALQGPHLFPFDLALPPIWVLEGCNSIEITRNGLDQEIRLAVRRAVSMSRAGSLGEAS